MINIDEQLGILFGSAVGGSFNETAANAIKSELQTLRTANAQLQSQLEAQRKLTQEAADIAYTAEQHAVARVSQMQKQVDELRPFREWVENRGPKMADVLTNFYLAEMQSELRALLKTIAEGNALTKGGDDNALPGNDSGPLKAGEQSNPVTPAPSLIECSHGNQESEYCEQCFQDNARDAAKIAEGQQGKGEAEKFTRHNFEPVAQVGAVCVYCKLPADASCHIQNKWPATEKGEM